jgi:hypothetical protein
LSSILEQIRKRFKIFLFKPALSEPPSVNNTHEEWKKLQPLEKIFEGLPMPPLVKGRCAVLKKLP